MYRCTSSFHAIVRHRQTGTVNLNENKEMKNEQMLPTFLSLFLNYFISSSSGAFHFNSAKGERQHKTARSRPGINLTRENDSKFIPLFIKKVIESTAQTLATKFCSARFVICLFVGRLLALSH